MSTRTATTPFARTAFAVALTTSLLAAQADSVEGDLRSREVTTRLAAVDAVAAAGRTDADKLLLPLLKDKDWEVQERAAMALGKAKAASAVKALIDLALDGDVVRIRRAAAIAAGAVDAAAAAESLWKKAKGKRQVAALEALALANRRQAPFADAEKLGKLLRDEDAALREAAAVAWLECAADRPAALRKLLDEPFVVVRCRALEAVAAAPRAEDLAVLKDALRGGRQHDVVERRLLRALAAALAEGHEDRAGRAADTLQGAGNDPLVGVRRARLAALLATGENAVFDGKQATAALRPCLEHGDGTVRAAAAKALREVGGEDALAAALQHFGRETDRRVQRVLVETVAALRPPTTPAAVEWLCGIARGQYDDAVRERAIVRLGRSGVEGASDTLVELLGDRQWELAVCAAVSLGRTDADAAFEPLVKLLKDQAWTHRGAAIVGLMHWNRKEAVEPLIDMLEDGDPVVAGAAHRALRTMSHRYELDAKPKSWRSWWEANRETHRFVDREETLDKLKKYGYAVPDSEIYDGLDVVVFTSRGDHIEQLLAELEIAHRTTAAGEVAQCGLHPEAIFVSNCTGEIHGNDLQPLSWFVRTGGSLFGSCWALSETIARVQPGVVQQARTRDQVLDDVRAMPAADSPLLTGVFPPAVVPIYHLEGAHLIEVIDPEWCEVLIDSPDAAERWGNGNLAAWFFCGHGVLFDSANHFDLQGLETAKDLKTTTDRQAYAVDHMGLSFERWRETRTAGYWKQANLAKETVPDLSAFRLLTNFVRSKRIGEY